jgi:hypothetical protein
MSLPIIARCEKCGRGFVWLPKQFDGIDHYPLQRVRMPRGPDAPRPECGGRVRMVGEGAGTKAALVEDAPGG